VSLNKLVFSSFTEYRYYARYLSGEQRKIIFKNLPEKQKEFLNNSYLKEGWSDLFYRNEIDEKIDEIKETYGYDMLNIRLKAIRGKSIYIPTNIWEVMEKQFSQFKPEVSKYVIGGLMNIIEEKNKDVSLIVYENI
jgi:hypothetical protein